jgi:hypothetical protein
MVVGDHKNTNTNASTLVYYACVYCIYLERARAREREYFLFFSIHCMVSLLPWRRSCSLLPSPPHPHFLAGLDTTAARSSRQEIRHVQDYPLCASSSALRGRAGRCSCGSFSACRLSPALVCKLPSFFFHAFPSHMDAHQRSRTRARGGGW